MLGNTNRGTQGFNPDSVRGELPGQSGAGMERMLLPVFMEMIKNMNANDLEGLLQNFQGGPFNSINTTPAAKTTQSSEQHRIEQLESMRMPENSHLIDEAIASGEAPGAFAIRQIKASLDAEEAVNDIVAEINRLYAERHTPVISQVQASSSVTGDESVEGS